MAANVQSLVQYWKKLDLPQLQRELDSTATELANKQDDSDISRKRLVDLSKEFKKTTTEDIRKAVIPLLKSFQSAVDCLLRRSKTAESAFLTIYRALIELPDPVPVLEHFQALQQRTMRNQDLEKENSHLKETLNEYNRELRDAKNQDVTIKLLREKLQEFEEQEDSSIEARTREREKELIELLEEKERQLEESHLEVDKKLEEAEKKVAQLQSALESSQSELLDIKSKYDEDSFAKSDEMEVVVNDLELANQRAALAEKEVHHLKDQLAAAKQSLQLADQIQKAPDMEQAVDVVARSSLELELAAKDKEISQLVDDIHRLQSTLKSLKETSASKIAQLEDIVNEKDRMIVELGEKLVKQQDYEDIKKELSFLKSMEFSVSRPWENSNEDSKSEGNKPLEPLALDKNKNSQSDSSPLKAAKTEITGSSQTGYPSSLQSVDSFGVLLGHEIVTNYSQQLVTKEERTSRPSSPTLKSTTTSKETTSVTTATAAVSASEDRKPSLPAEPSQFPVVPACAGTPPTSTALAVPTSSPDSEPIPSFIKDIVSGVEKSSSLDKLHESLRQNIDRYANETLNTLNISRCVRELLSVHNIGQRVFAKFVLGLSQGTVSELLSKPKPWDKLTEKGRDSYRKMHAWASDDNCIYMLKSLVPRRSKDPVGGGGSGGGGGGGGLPNYKQDDQGTEERIAQILNEAQMAMLTAKQENKSPSSLANGILSGNAADTRSLDSSDDTRGEGGGYEGGGTKSIVANNTNSNSALLRDAFVTNGSSPRRSRKYEHDDIPQEMVARIYQEELAKLIGQRVEEGFRTPRDQYERTQEEIRQALTIYHQELARLSHLMPPNPNSFTPFTANGNTFGTSLSNHGLSVSVTNTSSTTTTNSTPQESPMDATVGSRTRSESKMASASRDEPELRHHGSAFSLVRPKTETNSHSKSSSSSSSSSYLHNSSPAPPALLPLNDGSSVGCEDLSTSASPLQRMQSITNSLLSQSTVPTMPNPPQRPAKAVLPPITQQQFDQYNNLNTEDIVKKVKEQLSQYSISQRLFGESVLGLSQGSVSDLLARPKPWHMLTQKGREPFIRMKIFLEDDNAVHKLVASQYKIAPEKLMRTGGFGGTPNPPGIAPYGPPKMSPRPPESNHRVSESRQVTPNNSVYSSQSYPPRSSCVTPESLPLSLTVSAPSNPPTPALSTRKSQSITRGYSQPSVYEMAALTTDLDTQVITSKIKETLMAHNIGQKIFGEAVLGLSQGSVSELLSKPKPWHMLSIKGREPFIRMQMWLNDPRNVEMLQTLKNERREANKRRRTGDGPMDSPRSQSDGQVYGYSFAPPSPYPPAKKPRVLFTEEQKEALRLAFNLDPYPSTATIEFLATELNLSVRTITNWFHNHRMRMKQQPLTDDERKSSSDISSTSLVPSVREGLNFDPVHYRILLNQRLTEKFREKGGPPFVGNFGGSMPYLYSPYRNCSPLSSSGDDGGTLDLSMSSQLRNSMSGNNGRGVGAKTDTTGSSTDDRSNSEMNDDSNLSQDPGITELSDRDSVDESHRSSPLRHPAEQVRLSSTGSSNRRKPAMPQWVDPGLELSPDSDVHSEDEDEEDEEDAVAAEQEEIINGVCVRQTEDFDLLLPREETIHVMPAPAPDDNKRLNHKVSSLNMDVRDCRKRLDEDEMTNGNVAQPEDEEDEDDEMFASSKRCTEDDAKKPFMDQDESWDDAEAKDRRKNIEKLQQRLEKEDAGDAWEF